MNQAFEEIQEFIPKLTLKEKAALAHRLLRELDGEPDEDVEAAWLEESERRLDAYLKGEMEAVDGEVVMARIRSRLK